MACTALGEISRLNIAKRYGDPMRTQGVSLATLAAAALLLACEPDRAPLSPNTEQPDLAAGKTADPLLSPNMTGQMGTVSTTGTIDRGNAFFRSFGTNGRSCATCHLQGTDPLFAPVDGANCPSVTPADGAAGHSLLLNQGLI